MLVRSLAALAIAALCAIFSRTAGALAQGDTPPPAATATLDINQAWSGGRAAGRGTVRFTHAPMHLADVAYVAPYGMMVGGHVCPIDHGYFFPKTIPAGGEHFEVIAPADGFIVMVGHRTQLRGSTERQREYDDYALTIEHTGTFYTQYDLLTALDQAILEQLDWPIRNRFLTRAQGPVVFTRIPVQAGQVVGRIGGRSLDFSVINSEVRLPGLLDPATYGHYGWRIHVVDPLDYFDEPLRSELLRLNVRKSPPYFGKIDYDINGRIVGNWFLEGSGGYAGRRDDPRGYWMGHLALAYHHIQPHLIVISIGDVDGRPRQFAVEGNAPDPASVTAANGRVAYELISISINGRGEKVELPEQMRGVQGTLLVQLLEERRLWVEVFPGLRASQVDGFTDLARTYVR